MVFIFATETDHDAVAMRNALVYLLAVVVGSPHKTNLWYHVFSPKDLEGSFIPGFNVCNIGCYNSLRICHDR